MVLFFYHLLKHTKKEQTKRLNSLPRNFARTFNKDWLDGNDFSSNTDFQQEILKNTTIC